MFLLYHSEGCNICESVLRECYVNDLYNTRCSGVLGHCKRQQNKNCKNFSSFGSHLMRDWLDLAF
jgi:hypothetical protein